MGPHSSQICETKILGNGTAAIIKADDKVQEFITTEMRFTNLIKLH